MNHSDQWGHDQNVQRMRRLFALMERSQGELLKALNISCFDPRLRRARRYSRDLFEQIWPIAMQKGIVTSEDDSSLLYRYCLGFALKWSGIEVLDHVLPEDDRMVRFLKEKLK